MKTGSIFWVVDYIKMHHDGISRFRIDQYLLRLGYDEGVIEEAWKIVSVPPKNRSLSLYQYLSTVSVFCSILSWFCLMLPWFRVPSSEGYPPGKISLLLYNTFLSLSFNIEGGFLYLPLILWGIFSLAGFLIRYFENRGKGKPYKVFLNINFAFIMVVGAADILFIVGNYMRLDWPGPLALTLVLLTALTCNFIEINYPREKVKIILFS